MKTIFFGASAYVLPIIELLDREYDLQLVVTTEQKPTDAVPAYCIQHNIPFVSVIKLDEQTRNKLSAIQAPFAVLADFGLLIPQSVLDMFPKGIINIHPSLLPEYRGPTPGQSALLDGKDTTGISIMLLDKELDHGPVLEQIEAPILPDDTSASLYPRLFEKGTELLEKVLPEYIEGKIQLKEQDHTKATFTNRHLTRESGFFDLANPPSPEQLKRMIKAFYPWPGVWTRYMVEGHKLNGKIIKFLPEGKLQVEGKKPMSYKDFLNGYPEAKDLLVKLQFTS